MTKWSTKDSEKVDMVLTLDVKGREGLKATIEYLGTDLKTVKMVEAAVMEALAGLNEEA